MPHDPPSYGPVYWVLGIMAAGCALMLLGFAYTLLGSAQ